VTVTRREEGFTVIEVLVATLVLVIGLIGTLGAFDSSRDLTSSAEAHQSASAVADQELQRVEALSWTNLALTTVPTRPTGVTSSNPLYYLQSASATCAGGPTTNNCFQWNWSSSSSTLYESLVTGGSDTTADPWTWTSTNAAGGTQLSFQVYRFITWVDDTNCTLSTCGSSNGYKRIVVAVTGTDLDQPMTLMTLVTNPVYGSADALMQAGTACTDGSQSVKCVKQS
jgi:Tfp pilus assembly protein PilV